MVVGEASINNIMGGIESTGGVRLHNHKKKLKQRFDIIKKLGQGTYGKVQLGINKETGQEVAIKTIKKSKIETEADLIRIRREIQIMSSVQHPNIIHIYEVFENREKMVLVMEYAAGGELYDYLSERKVLAEDEARRIFRQIATACYYCHKHKICHRDLKLENILLDENGNAKIADFGLSNVFDDQRLLSTFCGSPLYASPEIVKGTPYHGPEVDCWSLGVLLYTLVYGAMPFDGSNFKRLVKQISQGDYFEPKKPSPASPLIREMLTVNPRKRANISKICAHWWVNESYDESCLNISEELANLTPVRLDLLLSLAPPPPQLESEKLVVTGDVPDETMNEGAGAPTRSQSVGSLMDLQTPAERRIQNMIAEELKTPSKRKLETTISTDQANILHDGKRKEKINKENTVADISVSSKPALLEDAMEGTTPLDRSRTQTLSKEMEVEDINESIDPNLQGAACAEILEEAKKNDGKKPLAKTKTLTSSNLATTPLEDINENPSQENLCTNLDKENVTEKEKEKVAEKEVETKSPAKKKVVKKVLGVKNENGVQKEKQEEPVSLQTVLQKNDATAESNKKEPTINETNKTEIKDETPTKPIERRRSKIFEQAEKFQNMITANESKTTGPPEKPKKIVIPGVSVGGFKKEFERKASLTSTSPPKLKSAGLTKKNAIADKSKSPEPEKAHEENVQQPLARHKVGSPEVEEERKLMLKNAVNIISQALDKEGTRKSKSRPCIRKPPVPFGASGRSASGSIGMITTPLSPPPDKAPLHLQDSVRRKLEISIPAQVQCNEQEPEVENKTSSAEITLKSATLPRRKTAKAQIELAQPKVPTTMGFKTEMAHHIEAPPPSSSQQQHQPKLTTQRSEVIFPVSSPTSVDYRASSLEPDQMKTKERIIPISVDPHANDRNRETVTSPPAKPPTPRLFQTQKSNTSQKSGSNLSRQSTQDSDLESTGEPIKKSPREYIIPIAVEGGGYVTPRAGSLEPSDTSSTTSTMTNNSRRLNKYGRALRMNSLLNERDGSEDESPFGALHRHSSFGKDSDNEDSKKDMFHMHRLRSSRPTKVSLEHNDSVSSGEDDDDDGFEILTAENLFSTLLSRVRDLTQRLNVDGRPGFPSGRLLSHFGHETDFFNNMHSRLNSRNSPLGRTFNRERNTSTGSYTGVPWRRSVSRDLGTDIDSVFNQDAPPTAPLQTSTLPRGDNNAETNENLNLSDLDLKRLKLTDEDALALSYLTPGLSRRIQKQLFAQLPPSEAKKLTRTLSMRNGSSNANNNLLGEKKPMEKSSEKKRDDANYGRYSVDRVFSSTLPRKYSSIDSNSLRDDKQIKEIRNLRSRETTPVRSDKTHLPTKSTVSKSDSYQRPAKPDTNAYLPRSDGYQSKSDASQSVPQDTNLSKIRTMRSSSLREPSLTLKRDYSIKSPDSGLNDGYIYKEPSSSINKREDNSNDYGFKYNLYGSRTSLANNVDSPIKSDKRLELKQPNRKKISRFLRPDFYDNKEENVVQKEKKEREMETQQVLKEIRDKRVKNKLNLRRERSATRDASLDTARDKGVTTKLTASDETKIAGAEKNVEATPKPTEILENEKSDLANERSCEPASIVHDYVNVPNVDEMANNKSTKTKTSKLMRPKSYPFEGNGNKTASKLKAPELSTQSTPTEKDSNKSTSTQKETVKKSPEKEANASPEKETNKSKVKVKKSAASDKSKLKSPEPDASKSNKNKFLQSLEKQIGRLRSFGATQNGDERKSAVKSAINKLREQSVPRNLEHCRTESGLIKRAVSVEDITSIGTKNLQPSRKSVTKILNLFKKYEDNDDGAKKPKTKKKTEKAEETNGDQTPIVTNAKPQKLERPKSLALDKSKLYNAKSETKTTDARPEANSKSKLPVNSYRKSFNFDDTKLIRPKPTDAQKPETSDFVKPYDSYHHHPSINENRYSTTTDDSSLILSPCDDNMSCSSWSIGSSHHDLASPTTSYHAHHHHQQQQQQQPHHSHVYSGDEGESVIDRIRRKSFYSRFNEKKRPKKLTGGIASSTASSSNIALDLYKDLKPYRTNDYGSLDRRSVDYRSPSLNRRSSYDTTTSEPTAKRDYKSYGRSSSVLNDGYVNVPQRYDAYNSRRTKPLSCSLYGSDNDRGRHALLDDVPATEKFAKYSYQTLPSRSRLSMNNFEAPTRAHVDSTIHNHQE